MPYIDYTNNVIYKIQHNDIDELLYVGSTTDFTSRKAQHKSSSKHSNGRVYKMIRDNGGWECFSMVVLEEYPCEKKTQACKREDEIMRELKANMNTRKAYTGIVAVNRNDYYKQWFENNPEYRRQWCEDHADQIKTYLKQYYTDHSNEHKQRMKEWREANPDYFKQWRAKAGKVTCECGCVVSKTNLSTHKNSKKHFSKLT